MLTYKRILYVLKKIKESKKVGECFEYVFLTKNLVGAERVPSLEEERRIIYDLEARGRLRVIRREDPNIVSSEDEIDYAQRIFLVINLRHFYLHFMLLSFYTLVDCIVVSFIKLSRSIFNLKRLVLLLFLMFLFLVLYSWWQQGLPLPIRIDFPGGGGIEFR